MKVKIIVSGVVLLLFVTTVIIYAHRGNSSMPEVEINALYEFADKNGDGSISKEEFAAFLEARKAFSTQNTAMSAAHICPETGLPCAGDCGDSCSGGGAGGCCKEGGMTSAAPFAASGARKTAFEHQTTGGGASCCSGEGGGECAGGGCSGMGGGGCCMQQ